MSDELKAVASSDDYKYSFDFTEFFKISGGKFVHEAEINSFLDKLASQENRPDDDETVQYYPFADRDTRDVLRHTFWLLPGKGGIKIANTLKTLLQNHPVFGTEYKIISAVGTGDIDRQNESALREVNRTIGNQPWQTKTITLSCGQLTTGVTVKPWTGVLMLNNLKSPSRYLQAAFRAQNPWSYEIDGESYNKTDCYVFDFAPDRTLEIVKQYAVKLDTGGGTTGNKIKKLLNSLPVIAEDETGEMRSLDANDVMTLPLKLDVNEVVNNGFMDNKLFAVGNIFNLPKDKREEANEYLSQLKSVKNKKQNREETKVNTQDVEFDDEGNPIIDREKVINTTNGLLGDRKYAEEGSEEAEAVQDAIDNGEEPETEIASREEIEQKAREQLEDEAQQKKRDEQQQQRDHLRGFSRTIPMFLMAYGKPDTTLANFDKFVSAAVFEELAGISIEAFRFLRDECNLFNEDVFNASIHEFLARKQELAKYYLQDAGEDIFEYIPPQSKDNNQIFTPKKVVQQMVDTLETADPAIFKRDNTTFFDPHMKSGLFIAEIVKRLYRHSKIQDEHERIKHILTRQVYGFASTKILLAISQQTIASLNYKLWDNFVLQDEKRLETGLKGAIMDAWGDNMKFDVIIGNPPYQQSDGGYRTSASPIYQKFVQQAMSLKPKYLSMIIPARWYSGGKGLDEFRNQMLHDNRLTQIVDYPEASDAFSGVQIKGGVMYFLWNRDNPSDLTKVFTFQKDKIVSEMERPLLENGNTTFIRYNQAVSILNKIRAKNEPSLSKQISKSKPFGLRSFYKGKTESFEGSIALHQNAGVGYVAKTEITNNKDLIDKNKVLVPALGSGSDSFPHPILGKPFVVEQNSACTETYIVGGSFDSYEEAKTYKRTLALNSYGSWFYCAKTASTPPPKSTNLFQPKTSPSPGPTKNSTKNTA
jgi:hypothetical protein